MSYINYYNSENSLISFEFEGLTKEEATRLQAHLLQDSTFFIQDEEALKKISEEQQKLFKCDDYTKGEIYIKKLPENRDHYILDGYQKHVVGNDEYKFGLYANIYEGLNFIAFEGMKKNIDLCSYVSTTINWMYEKSYDPNKLVRFDIKNGPTEVFNKNKKETKVKKI